MAEEDEKRNWIEREIKLKYAAWSGLTFISHAAEMKINLRSSVASESVNKWEFVGIE